MSDSPKHEAIIDLLRVYRDLEGTSSSGGGGNNAGGDRLLYMDGGAWDKSGCDALDDCLRELRTERPVQWWHVTQRYLRCEVRPRRLTAHRTNSGKLRMPNLGDYSAALGGMIRPTESWKSTEILVVVETWTPQVRLEKVRRGVAFLSGRFPWDTFRWRDLQEAAAA